MLSSNDVAAYNKGGIGNYINDATAFAKLSSGLTLSRKSKENWEMHKRAFSSIYPGYVRVTLKFSIETPRP